MKVVFTLPCVHAKEYLNFYVFMNMKRKKKSVTYIVWGRYMAVLMLSFLQPLQCDVTNVSVRDMQR